MPSGLPIGGLPSAPPPRAPSGPPSMSIEHSHFSKHFRKGEYPNAIVQKFTIGKGKEKIRFHADTIVDSEGNVGESLFTNWAGKKLGK